MIEDKTIQLVSLALDASLMRETAIANNIANSNTKDYQYMVVNFEEQLREGRELENLRPRFETSETQNSIDQQMALNVQNMTQYRALIKGLNHKLSIMKLALEGNNAS